MGTAHDVVVNHNITSFIKVAETPSTHFAVNILESQSVIIVVEVLGTGTHEEAVTLDKDFVVVVGGNDVKETNLDLEVDVTKVEY